jgi:ferredoxin
MKTLTDSQKELLISKGADLVGFGDLPTREYCEQYGAIKGNLWDISTPRDTIFDTVACRKEARKRAMQSFGIEITICGKCIEVCPYTQKYVKGEGL